MILYAGGSIAFHGGGGPLLEGSCRFSSRRTPGCGGRRRRPRRRHGPDGHGHPTLVVNLLGSVASEVSLLREVHAAEEAEKTYTTTPKGSVSVKVRWFQGWFSGPVLTAIPFSRTRVK